MRLGLPAPVLPSVERRNMRIVVIDGVAVGLMSAAASFVSVMVVRLGASALWVSLLSSLPAVIALVMTIPWSEFVSRQEDPQRIFAFSRLVVHVVYPLIAIVPFFLHGELAAGTRQVSVSRDDGRRPQRESQPRQSLACRDPLAPGAD